MHQQTESKVLLLQNSHRNANYRLRSLSRCNIWLQFICHWILGGVFLELYLKGLMIILVLLNRQSPLTGVFTCGAISPLIGTICWWTCWDVLLHYCWFAKVLFSKPARSNFEPASRLTAKQELPQSLNHTIGTDAIGQNLELKLVKFIKALQSLLCPPKQINSWSHFQLKLEKSLL